MAATTVPSHGSRNLLFYALILGPLRENPGRAVLSAAAIALGVALGVAVHLINSSALNEFEIASRHLAGAAGLVVRGPRAGFDESLYPLIAGLPQVEAANPAVEADVPLAGRQDSLRILGFDPLRAAQVQPAFLPERSGLTLDPFDADAILLSRTAGEWLRVKAGDEIMINVGTATIPLKVAGLLPGGVYRQRLGVMDIAAAQWRLALLGRLNRIDLRLKAGTDVATFRKELQAMLPAGVIVAPPEAEAARGASLTLAYRLNLDMLALVALFTGAFLIFSSQVLSMLRRRTHLALVRALGLTRWALATHLVLEGAALGAAGAALGVALGWLLARFALARIGADLGAGYFRTITTSLHADPAALILFFAIGMSFAVAGAAAPAWEAASRPPARALRAGDEEESLAPLSNPWWGIFSMAAGLALALAPALNGLPIAGYGAIALELLGAVMLMPWLTEACLDRLPLPPRVTAGIAVAQLKATPRQSAISIAAIVTSFSLMASMLIMVYSFRTSLEDWLERMLPADLYLRAVRSGDTGFLTPEEQATIAATPGLARVQFLRRLDLLLDSGRPPVVLLAGPADAARILPLVGPSITPQAGGPAPVWISEVAAELYEWRIGDPVHLPLAGVSRPFIVAGVWRDYVRQSGAVAIDRELYIRLTGDRLANDAAIWLAPGASIDEAGRALRERLPANATVEIATTRSIRANSLALFDRTFAITYALEVAAVLIGLAGVGISFSAQALARRRDFGVLRHLGMTRREIGALLATEGALVSAIGVASGLAVGWLVSLILVHVINRQSFHWSMEINMPWLPLAALAAIVVSAAVATAAWSGRAAMGDDVVRAVREDW